MSDECKPILQMEKLLNALKIDRDDSYSIGETDCFTLEKGLIFFILIKK
jgi:hypothetical protein